MQAGGRRFDPGHVHQPFSFQSDTVDLCRAYPLLLKQGVRSSYPLMSLGLNSCNGPSQRSRRQTTQARRAQPEKFRITHPFHSLSGCEFEAPACKEYSGEQRVCFLDKKGRQCEIPLSWTDLAAKDPGTILASRKSWFRAADLVELARLVEGLQR